MPQKIVIVRPLYEVELEGGEPSYTYHVGSVFRLHPACDLFAQGATQAELRRVVSADGAISHLLVRPIVSGRRIAGKLRAIQPDQILHEGASCSTG